ncbi:hypothetical protein M758_1G185000 [Ceratodon purpureus]|uniref:Uncharacterized protein n=1 Tax=Ceratodon purpureus TaxID=3225 RepID=A0A8T0J7W6_CERPU|nr:hypothetical protein KC19_1G188400 [Ceratodon purpureus]KAG0630527.1 hypothetical protein M758_1G185000 [Ceratodon purpureus]
MFRELNTPAPDPDVDTSFSVPDLNAESPVPNLEAHSPNLKAPTVYEEVVETTIKKTTATKFKFKKLEKKVENSGECDKPKQDDAPQESPVEDLRAPKIQTEYIGRPVVTVVIIVTFPLDFIGLEDMHVYMTSTGIFIDTKAYGPLEVELQFYVSPAGVLAEYIKCDKTLRFELPIVSYAQAQKLKL